MNLCRTKRTSEPAVTIIGLLLLIAVLAAVICGTIALKNAAVAAGHRVADAHDKELEEAAGDGHELAKMAANAPEEDLFIITPNMIVTPLTNDWVMIEIPDEEFARAKAEYRTWAILTAQDPGGPWEDSGNRLDGNPMAIQKILRDWCEAEAPWARDGGHSDGRRMTFYRAVKPEDVLVVIPENQK